ncbi:nitronate monooxygenase [Soonwooa buanensis]|uniref:Propionate 3-nitronate monooxygenase n=1 Tax=Soonwooa buanensis TaxID=619805 RepID=A0A1T5G8F7_9FLAO|nr:nitronate monooxygenase family protein [Soonwooa buanensis]SKC04662.1 nitronate monooxygenase [Soonwooa buanensis]
MNWNNQITELLQIKYPFIQAPMLGVSTPEMLVAAGEAGCLGSLALGDLDAETCLKNIHQVQQMTDRSFAANIFVHQLPKVNDELKFHYEKTKLFLENFAKNQNLEVEFPDFESIKLHPYQEQINAIIDAKAKIFSFTFGNIDAESIEKLKSKNINIIGTCTSLHEALELEKNDVDLICVQGLEAGGHRGSFVDENIPKIGGLSLLNSVFEKVKKPIIYAGGLCNSQTILAAKTLGAQAFQIGSMLLCSEESQLNLAEKQKLKSASEQDIMLIKSFSGRYARGLQNTFTDAFENSEYVLPYPYQNKLTANLRKVAKSQSNVNFSNIWTGQSIGHFSEKSTKDILQNLIKSI